MFGQKVWRPVAVAVVMTAVGFLPQGVAVAATPGTIDTVTCSQISAELRNGSLNCSPLKHDGVDGVFIGPVTSGGASPAGGTTSGSATTGGGSGSTNGSGSGSGSGSGNGSENGPGNGSGDGAATPTSPTTEPTTGTPPTEPTTPPTQPTTQPTQPTTQPSTGGSGSGSGGSDDDESDDDSDDDGSSGSGGSGSGGSSGSGSSGSRSSGSSGSGGSSYSTNTGVTLGAAACPAGVGGTTGSGGSTATTVTGSVDTGTTTTSGTASTPGPNSDVSGAASVTDVTGGLDSVFGNRVGTVTNTATSPAGSALAPVAGTVTTSGAAAVAGTGTAGSGNANLPADVIDLATWYLTLPTGAEGSPDTIENPNLTKFANEYFKVNNSRDGVVFSARADGVTTKNSSYPRSELREMNGGEKASWSNTTGSHTLDVCEAITKTPSSKPEVVAAQIHDGKDDVMQIRLEGKTLMVQYNDGGSEIVIDPNYQLGTPYNVRIVAAGGKVDVLYNGQKKAELPLSGSGWYWKVGAYVQSSTSKGESPDATGEVTVYSLKNVHS